MEVISYWCVNPVWFNDLSSSILPYCSHAISAGTSKVLILVTPRDYRDGNVKLTSTKQRQEPSMQTKVRSETEIVFQIVGTSRSQHFRLGDVLFLSLSP